MRFDYLILAGGKFPPVSFVRSAKKICHEVVAVDRGLDLAKKAGIKWDKFIGDADSVRTISRSEIKKRSNKLDKLLPIDKSLSDLEWALKKLMSSKKTSALILASHQDHEGRTDHLYANLLLAMKWPGRVYLADPQFWIVAIKNQKFFLQGKPGSIFSLSSPQNYTVTIKGAHYQTKNLKVSSITHGLSNKISKSGKVEIKIKGSALLFASGVLF